MVNCKPVKDASESGISTADAGADNDDLGFKLGALNEGSEYISKDNLCKKLQSVGGHHLEDSDANEVFFRIKDLCGDNNAYQECQALIQRDKVDVYQVGESRRQLLACLKAFPTTPVFLGHIEGQCKGLNKTFTTEGSGNREITVNTESFGQLKPEDACKDVNFHNYCRTLTSRRLPEVQTQQEGDRLINELVLCVAAYPIKQSDVEEWALGAHKDERRALAELEDSQKIPLNEVKDRTECHVFGQEKSLTVRCTYYSFPLDSGMNLGGAELSDCSGSVSYAMDDTIASYRLECKRTKASQSRDINCKIPPNNVPGLDLDEEKKFAKKLYPDVTKDLIASGSCT